MSNAFLQLNQQKIEKLVFQLEGQRLTNQFGDIDLLFITTLITAMVSEIKNLSTEIERLKEQK